MIFEESFDGKMQPRVKAKAKAKSAGEKSVGSHRAVVRAEVISADEFAIVLEEPRVQQWMPVARLKIVQDLEASAQSVGVSVEKVLQESDRCELNASTYLPLHDALVAAGHMTAKGSFSWLPLPSWVLGALPCFGAKETIHEQPATLWLTEGLMAYQNVAVKRALVQGGRVLLADEMGLGKTAEALAVVAQYLEREGPALIITPSSLVGVWKNQIKQWLPELSSSEVQIVMGAQECLFAQARIVILSYTTFVRNPKVFSRNIDAEPWKIVVCDEAHYLRNPTSQRTKVLLPVLQAAPRVILVTGTPTPKQASEAYTLLHALRPLGCTFKEWCKHYGAGRTERREAEVAAMLAEVMVRHMKAEVMEQLPPRHRQRVELQLPASAKAALRKFQDSCTDKEHFSQLARVKEAAAQDYVEYLIDASTQKFVLFGHHRAMLDALEKTVGARGVSLIRIDGSTPVAERPALVRRFQMDPECRVAILSILAAGEGLTFTAASLCVFCEMCPAVPGVIEQAEARIHRIGQTASHIDVHFLVVDGTRDDKVFTRLESRTDDVALAIGRPARDAAPRFDHSEDARAVSQGIANSLAPSNQYAAIDRGPRRDKPLARQTPTAASEASAVPKKKRRKPGFDLSSMLEREIIRAKADMAASDSLSAPASAELASASSMTINTEMPQVIVESAAASVATRTARADTIHEVEQLRASARSVAAPVPATTARAGAPLEVEQLPPARLTAASLSAIIPSKDAPHVERPRLSASDMALAFFATSGR